MNAEQVLEADRSLRDLYTKLRGLQKDCDAYWYKNVKVLIFDTLQSLPTQSKESADKMIEHIRSSIDSCEYKMFIEEQRKRDAIFERRKKFGDD